MRIIKIEIDIQDEGFIYLHRKLKKLFDEEKHWYGIKSWRFTDEEEVK